MKVSLMTKIHLNKTEELVNVLDDFQIEFEDSHTSLRELTTQKDQTTHGVKDVNAVKELIQQLRENCLYDLNVMVDTSSEVMEFIIDEI